LPNIAGSCENLWDFGRELKTQLLGPEKSNDESDMISVGNIIHGLKFLGKSILGYSKLLSAFNSKIYSARSLDVEFIARLPEIDSLTYGSEEAIESSMAGRYHYCQHILPEVIKAIKSHSLQDKIIFDANQDFGCASIAGSLANDNIHLEL
jgi:hypothetical protein